MFDRQAAYHVGLLAAAMLSRGWLGGYAACVAAFDDAAAVYGISPAHFDPQHSHQQLITVGPNPRTQTSAVYSNFAPIKNVRGRSASARPARRHFS